MASKVSIVLLDDLDGTVLEDGAGETVNFALDGTSYEIDLSSKNADKLRKALQTYVGAARKVGKPSGRRGGGSGSKSDYDAKAVRAWAQENGIDVPSRGRIPGEVVDQYKASH